VATDGAQGAGAKVVVGWWQPRLETGEGGGADIRATIALSSREVLLPPFVREKEHEVCNTLC
jgi:hypothetical protein